MFEQPLGKKYSRFVNALIFIFPVVINLLQVAGDIVLLILAIMGIYIAISKKLSPFKINEIKVFSYLTIGYFTTICLSVIFSGQAVELAHYIPRDFYFLFAPFIALAFYKAEININFLIFGVKVSLLVLGGLIFYQLMTDPELLRPSGVMNPGVFGNLAVALFFTALAFFKQESFRNKILTSLSLISGLFIIIASGTRGAWLSFFLLLGVYLYFLYKRKIKLSTLSKIITVAVIGTILSFGSLFSNVLLDRINPVSSEISIWMSGAQKLTPIGLRLEMYNEAINNIEDVPFFGYGLRTSNISLFKNTRSEIGIVSSRFNHLHNAFLTNYYNGGILLLGTLVSILLVPCVIFIKANIQNRENPIFIAGAFLTIGYASFGMVNILLGDTYMNGFYTFFLAIFMLITAKSIKAR